MRAPVSATHRVAARSAASGPVIVHSSAAASASLPTSRFANRNARSSIGPDGGTPTSQ